MRRCIPGTHSLALERGANQNRVKHFEWDLASETDACDVDQLIGKVEFRREIGKTIARSQPDSIHAI